MTRPVVKKVFHLFGAIGGGAKGFKRARAEVAGLKGEWQCLGSVDIDEAANRDFERLIGVRATTLDLLDRDRYIAFHGHEPPPQWREATPDDIRRAAQYERPHAVFLSPPCKGFSGLLSEAKSRTAKYLALNRLALRGVWLMLEAWADDPPEMVLIENVPRLMTRGRQLVDQILAMLRHYGYAAVETVHDCGQLGRLAQSRKRCLIVARHIEKVPPLLYEPPRHALRAVGDVLSKMPLPGSALAGPMHRVPNLQWKTWVRLAFVEAGSDWRSLNRLVVANSYLRDYLLVPEKPNPLQPSWPIMHHGASGEGSVADPRFAQSEAWNDGQAYGVRRWDNASATITSKLAPGSGYGSLADPRRVDTTHDNSFRVVRAVEASLTINAEREPGGGALAVPNSRPQRDLFGKYAVSHWDGISGTVISGSTTGQGAYAVADPRPGLRRGAGDAYVTAGHYGVVRWEDSSGTVSSAACHDNGPWSVADARIPAGNEKLLAVICAKDGTWHRPFTTLELAALQSLFDPEDPADMAAFTLDGDSDSAWRERIGNAVPPDAAEAIAAEILRTLLLADAGETFQLSNAPIWVKPVAAALTLAQGVLEG